MLKLPLQLKPYTFVFHGVLVGALLTGMGYAIDPPKNDNDIIVRLTAFFVLLLIQSFLWMMRERAFSECKEEIKYLKETIVFHAKNGYIKENDV